MAHRIHGKTVKLMIKQPEVNESCILTRCLQDINGGGVISASVLLSEQAFRGCSSPWRSSFPSTGGGGYRNNENTFIVAVLPLKVIESRR